MYSEKSSARASHQPAAFCAFRLFLLVPFTALPLSIVGSRFFVKAKARQNFVKQTSNFPNPLIDIFRPAIYNKVNYILHRLPHF